MAVKSKQNLKLIEKHVWHNKALLSLVVLHDLKELRLTGDRLYIRMDRVIVTLHIYLWILFDWFHLSAPSWGDQWLRRETSVYLPNCRRANNSCLLNFSHQFYDCYYSIYIIFSHKSVTLLAGSTNTFLTSLLQYKFSLFFFFFCHFATIFGDSCWPNNRMQAFGTSVLAFILFWNLGALSTFIRMDKQTWLDRVQYKQSVKPVFIQRVDASLTVTVGAANAKLKSRGRGQTSCLGRM